MRIFLDMDEVLADFVGGAASAFGLSLAELEAQWVPGEWGIYGPLGRALTARRERGEGGRGVIEEMTPERFWDRIRGNAWFWSDLAPLPWMRDIVTLVASHSAEEDWAIVTSPSRCPSCYLGKAAWVASYLGDVFLPRLILMENKTLLARSPGAVLIDDREETVTAFRAAGGRGILFPRLHNSLYGRRDDPVRFVRRELVSLREEE